MQVHEVFPHWLCNHDGLDVYCEVCHHHERHSSIHIEMILDQAADDADD